MVGLLTSSCKTWCALRDPWAPLHSFRALLLWHCRQ